MFHAFSLQKRHGWNGNIINVWKSRSMRQHDGVRVKLASCEDSRITRRTSTDE